MACIEMSLDACWLLLDLHIARRNRTFPMLNHWEGAYA
jgi:hypothetical protein